MIGHRPSSANLKVTGEPPSQSSSPRPDLDLHRAIGTDREAILGILFDPPPTSPNYRAKGASYFIPEESAESDLRVSALRLFASNEGLAEASDTVIHGVMGPSDSVLRDIANGISLHATSGYFSDSSKVKWSCGAVTLPNGDIRLWKRTKQGEIASFVTYPRHLLPQYLESSITLPGAPVNRVKLFENLRDAAEKDPKVVPASILAQSRAFISTLTKFSIQLPFRVSEIDESKLPDGKKCIGLTFFDSSFANACRSFELLDDFARLSALAHTLSDNLRTIVEMTLAETDGHEKLRAVLNSKLGVPLFDELESPAKQFTNRFKATVSRLRDSLKSLKHADEVCSFKCEFKRALVAAYLLDCSEGRLPNQIIRDIAKQRSEAMR